MKRAIWATLAALLLLALVALDRLSPHVERRSPKRVVVDLEEKIYWCEPNEPPSRRNTKTIDLCRAQRAGFERADENQTCTVNCQQPIDADWFPQEAALEASTGGLPVAKSGDPLLRMLIIGLVALGILGFIVLKATAEGTLFDDD